MLQFSWKWRKKNFLFSNSVTDCSPSMKLKQKLENEFHFDDSSPKRYIQFWMDNKMSYFMKLQFQTFLHLDWSRTLRESSFSCSLWNKMPHVDSVRKTTISVQWFKMFKVAKEKSNILNAESIYLVEMASMLILVTVWIPI